MSDTVTSGGTWSVGTATNTTGREPAHGLTGGVRASIEAPPWHDSRVHLELSGYEAVRLLDCLSHWRPCERGHEGREAAATFIENALRKVLPQEKWPKAEAQPLPCPRCAKNRPVRRSRKRRKS